MYTGVFWPISINMGNRRQTGTELEGSQVRDGIVGQICNFNEFYK